MLQHGQGAISAARCEFNLCKIGVARRHFRGAEASLLRQRHGFGQRCGGRVWLALQQRQPRPHLRQLHPLRRATGAPGGDEAGLLNLRFGQPPLVEQQAQTGQTQQGRDVRRGRACLGALGAAVPSRIGSVMPSDLVVSKTQRVKPACCHHIRRRAQHGRGAHRACQQVKLFVLLTRKLGVHQHAGDQQLLVRRPCHGQRLPQSVQPGQRRAFVVQAALPWRLHHRGCGLPQVPPQQPC